jgi:hypothetical protein
VSAVGDAVRGLHRILLLKDSVLRLEKALGDAAGDIDRLAREVGALRERLARIEGFIHGAAAAGPVQPRLPSD